MNLPPLSEFSAEQQQTIQAHIDHQLREQQAAHQQAQQEQAAARAREETVRQSAPAQDEEPRSSDTFTDQIVEGVTRAFKGIQVQEQQQQRAGASAPQQAGTAVRISHNSSVRPAVFDGIVKNGEQIQQKVLIFRGQMGALFGQEDCLEAVETDVPIKVGRSDANVAALTAEFGEGMVDKARRAWGILVSQITALPVLQEILEAGSPSEGWSIFKNHYAPQSAAERARLTQAWYNLQMKEGEPPNEYFARGSVIRSQLGSHGMVFSDVDANHHFVRNVSHVFGVQKSILLTNADLSRQVLEDVVLSAHGEMEMAREQERRNGTGHALVAPDSGRGNEGGGRGGRGRNRRNENRGGQQHQQHQQHQ